MKEFFRVIFLGFIIGVLLASIQVLVNTISGSTISFDLELLKLFAYFQLYAIPLSLVTAYLFKRIKLKFKDESFGLKRLLISVVSSVIVTFLTLYAIEIFIHTTLSDKPINSYSISNRLAIYMITIFVNFFIILIHHTVAFYKKLQQSQVVKHQVIAGSATASFDALKNQLDPHFLFNSLNVLTSLIDENPKNAKQFTTALSKIYRYVLEEKNKTLVSVDDELDFAETYILLLKMRFENGLIFSLPETTADQEGKIIPLALQLALENAVKHNIVSDLKPLHISIYEEANYLIIHNNLQPKTILKSSSGVGLSNIIQRYSLLTDREVIIEKTENDFSLKLPILTQQIELMITDNSDEKYLQALTKVEAIKELYQGVIAYVLIVPLLIFINYKTSWDYKWFWYPLLIWGGVLIIEAFNTYYKDHFFGSKWQEKKIQQFMREEQENQKNKY